MVFWIGGKIPTMWLITCFDSKLKEVISAFSFWISLASLMKRAFLWMKLIIALWVQVNNQDLAFSNSTLSLFIHNFSKTSCTISCASSWFLRKLTAKRYNESLWFSTLILYSFLLNLWNLQLKQLERTKSYRSNYFSIKSNKVLEFISDC